MVKYQINATEPVELSPDGTQTKNASHQCFL